MKDKTISKSSVSGSINIISSKSFIHRALIAASLCDQSSTISNVTYNDDIIRTVEALNSLGANIVMGADSITIDPISQQTQNEAVEIDANESGSTLRFLIPLAGYLFNNVTFVGRERLMERPQTVYKQLYDESKVSFNHSTSKIEVGGFPILSEYRVAGNVSSQFITGLMFVLPLLNQCSKIILQTSLQSKPYVDMTIQILGLYGVKIEETHYGYYIRGSQTYCTNDIHAEGDFSQAAFFAVLGAINNDVTISNLNFESHQGDKEIIKILKDVGIEISLSNDFMTVHKGDIKSTVIDLMHIPDLGPILFVLALFSDEAITFKNIERLRIKESDRVTSMQKELAKFGAKIHIDANTMIIHRLEKFARVHSVYAHNDHRIAMALSILATTLEYPLLIKDSKCVNKSYPNFFLQLEKLNVNIK